MKQRPVDYTKLIDSKFSPLIKRYVGEGDAGAKADLLFAMFKLMIDVIKMIGSRVGGAHGESYGATKQRQG